MIFSKSQSLKVEDLVGAPGNTVPSPEEPVPTAVNLPAPEASESAVALPSESSTSVPQVRPAGGARDRNFRFDNSRRQFGRGDRRGASGERQMEDVNVPTTYREGILDMLSEGNGILRPHFRPSNEDIYVSQSQIRRFALREGDLVGGQVRSPKENERYSGLLKVEKINGQEAETLNVRPDFDKLTAIYPKAKINLETDKDILATRVIDLLAPIGFGQRGLIVSPPKAGKTTILKQIAKGIEINYPAVHLMAVLIGERPEEVTDLTRCIKGDVVASNFDEPAQMQTRVAEIALERAKRLVENKVDVVILLDSITRLARAYNLCVPSSGRALSGGFDPAALFPTKKFFGAARCAEEGGSLTIIGTSLVDTGSRLDDLVYEEFKGTGNMELHLSRKLSERRVFPAIDVAKSGTRAEELLFSPEDLKKVITMHRMFDLLDENERTEMFLEKLGKTASNREFLDNLGKG